MQGSAAWHSASNIIVEQFIELKKPRLRSALKRYHFAVCDFSPLCERTRGPLTRTLICNWVM